jgi:CO/xanthine dehydrogenase Mo-binding subunit
VYPEYLAEIKKLLKVKEYNIVGKNMRRVDGLDKVTGRERYTADLPMDNTLVVRPVASPHPHARIVAIDDTATLAITGVVRVITAADIPAFNECGYYINDQPLIACDKVRHVGEIVALVVARDEAAAWNGAEVLAVTYEELVAVFDPQEALEGNFGIHKRNSPETVRVRKGDADSAFSRCDVIVERRYKAGSQDHAYLEPEAAMAIPAERGGMTVISTNQGPFRVRNAVARVLGKQHADVRIMTPMIGGGFGGKDTYGPIVSSLAAVAAQVTGQPAVLMLTRRESFLSRYKRCPFDIRFKSGASKDGKLLAIEVEYTADCGGYTAHAVPLMKRAAYHATGIYEVPHCKVTGVAVYTNNLPCAAFNGFGNPQMGLATESQMDQLAEALDMDPVALRLNNALVPGSYTGTNQLLDHSVGIKPLIEQVAQRASWSTKKARRPVLGSNSKRRGIGIGCSWHGNGTTGYKQDWAGASLILNPDGSATYCTGIVEIGQGTITSHAMMVAEILGIPFDSVKVVNNDTSRIPDSGETHAQRGTIIGGTAAVDAALKLRRRLNTVAGEVLECTEENISIENGLVFDVTKPNYRMPFKDLAMQMYQCGATPSEYGFILARRGHADDNTGLGDVYETYSFGCIIAEVEVDMEMGQVDVLKLFPGVAAGKILQPEVVRGQINGCCVLGLGYALTEAVVREKGKMLNGSLTDYLIPTIQDMPKIADYVAVEDEYKYSGFGAKGVGELCLIATPLAIVNAVYDATGVRFHELPLRREDVFFSFQE